MAKEISDVSARVALRYGRLIELLASRRRQKQPPSSGEGMPRERDRCRPALKSAKGASPTVIAMQPSSDSSGYGGRPSAPPGRANEPLPRVHTMCLSLILRDCTAAGGRRAVAARHDSPEYALQQVNSITVSHRRDQARPSCDYPHQSIGAGQGARPRPARARGMCRRRHRGPSTASVTATTE